MLKAQSIGNPDSAELFYIPVYTAQLYHSLLLNTQKGHVGSLNETATTVAKALHWVKTTYPYWNRTNGLVSTQSTASALEFCDHAMNKFG